MPIIAIKLPIFAIKDRLISHLLGSIFISEVST
jgi:hypothetical protein